MRYRSWIVVAAALVLFHCATARAVVVNGSFESQTTPLGTFTTQGITGWTQSAGGGQVGVWHIPHGSFFTIPAPDGNNIGYSNGPSLAQQLDDTVEVGTSVATVWAGRRDDAHAGSFTFEMWAGGTVSSGVVTGGTLLDSVFFDHTKAAASTFTLLTLEYEALAGNALLGQKISLRFVKGVVGQMDFDLVEFVHQDPVAATVPEPTLLSLAVAGALLGALGRRCGRRAARA